MMMLKLPGSNDYHTYKDKLIKYQWILENIQLISKLLQLLLNFFKHKL